MPLQGWRSRRVIVAVAVAAPLIGVSALLIVLSVRNQQPSDAAALPPIMPTAEAPYASAEPEFHIPTEVTASDDARAKIPLTQPEVHWVFADGPNFPPLVSPCGGYLPSDALRVGGHQLALVSPLAWKLGRMVVYKDVESARQAMSERRSALQQCAHHDDGNGITTVWISQPLLMGDEALSAGSQRYRGSHAIPGHQRGVVVRQGRTLVTFFDSGQYPIPPTYEEIASYSTVAQPIVAKLASAPWNQ